MLPLAPFRSSSPFGSTTRLGLALLLVFCCFVYGFFFSLSAPYLIAPTLIPVVVLGGMVIWALPAMGRAPTGILEGLFFAFQIALVAWPNYLALDLAGLPWITILRLVGFPLVTTLFICLSISEEFRRDLAGILKRTPWIFAPVVAFGALETLSISFSSTVGASIQRLLVDLINWTAVFFVSCYVFARPGRARRWSAILWGLAIYVSVLALLEFQQRHILWAGYVPSFLKVDSPVGYLSGWVRRWTGEYRAKGTFSTPLTLAEFLVLSIPFILHFLMAAKSVRVRVAAAASIPLVMAAILTTGARLGVAGAIVAFSTFGLVYFIRRWRQAKDDILAPAALLAAPVAIGAVVTASFFVHRLRKLVWGGGAQQASNQGRLDQLQEGIPKILHNPFGYGVGRAASTLGHPGANGNFTIDNYFLYVVLETGILGFVLYFGMLIVAIGHSLAAAIAGGLDDKDSEASLFLPIASAVTSFVVIKSVFSQQDNHPLIFMMLGMIVALRYRLARSAAPAPAGQVLAGLRRE